MPSSYFPLDVNFFDHPKVVPLGDGAVRLHLSAIGYANRLMTDGFIARPIPGRLGDTAAFTYAGELVGAVLWHRADQPCPRGHDDVCPKLDGDGWRIHDFLDHNRSRDSRLAAQESERDRKAAWRKRQRDADVPRDTTVPGDAGLRHIGDVPGTGNTETETETETETTVVPPTAARVASATPASITPIPTAQTFVAAYVDAYRGRAGHDPPARVKGQVAKHLREALNDGVSTDHIKAGFVEWFEDNKHPATLPSYIEIAGRNGQSHSRPTSRILAEDAKLAHWANTMEGGEPDAAERMAPHRGPARRELPRPGTPG